jgi:general L-amino acid transport system substrate-binding protein|tara:strand:- start:1304 stop:2311 length:1008 start_codon:yes stop_codon:yes gene_type:complete
MKQLFKLSLASVLVAGSMAVQAGTLADVLDRGELHCGVTTGVTGFSAPDSAGNWSGIDVDGCRSVAAAVFGDASKVKYVPLTAKERFTALQSGEIDVLYRNTTWTMQRDASLGLNFAGVNYYDGQGFMVMKSLGVSDAMELDGASVCIQAGTTTELNLADWAGANGISYDSVVVETSQQSLDGFLAGRCDVLTSDVSQLASLRAAMDNPGDAVVLGNVISKEPLGPVVRQGDDEWFNIVKWTLIAMIQAEESGVTSENIDTVTTNPTIERLAGRSSQTHEYLHLSPSWSYDIIKQVGNYGESFERNIGVNTPIGLSRGPNELWTKGGILYAPAFR